MDVTAVDWTPVPRGALITLHLAHPEEVQDGGVMLTDMIAEGCGHHDFKVVILKIGDSLTVEAPG